MLGGLRLLFFFFKFWEKLLSGSNWKAGVTEDLISSDFFCTHGEGSLSRLEVEGHESLACDLPITAHTKQITDSTAQSFSEDFCPQEGRVISILRERL